VATPVHPFHPLSGSPAVHLHAMPRPHTALARVGSCSRGIAKSRALYSLLARHRRQEITPLIPFIPSVVHQLSTSTPCLARTRPVGASPRACPGKAAPRTTSAVSAIR